MLTEKALALVIRSVDFSESSRVVTLFTREFGKLGALAKGAKRLKGPFAGALDLLSVCRIVLIRKYSESLDVLTEAELVKGFAPDRNRLQVLYAGYYVAELLQELTEDYDPHPVLFDAAVECLRDLESKVSLRMVVRRFELATLRETGHLPQFEACVSCGRALAGSRSVTYSAAAGGVLCSTCGSDRRTIRLSAGSLKVIQLLSDATNSQWRRLQVQAGMEREIGAVTRATIEHLVGRNLRTTQFLGESSS
ncbi:MAG: DNA repair protein RecO [Planctomycetes bacterium]|nr:DNA repair protein RecO [Planctomycetota bacterium]